MTGSVAVLPYGDWDAVLVDVDGTLVDSNYQHVLAWQRAFARCDIAVPAWRIHQAIGMGGDRLVAEVASRHVEIAAGDRVRAVSAQEFAPYLDEIPVLAGARDLLAGLRAASLPVALTSSGSAEHVQRHIAVLGAAHLVDTWTSGDDVAATKPAPDLLDVAVERLGCANPVVLGDSPWDAVAAGRIGAPMLGVLTGGFAAEELMAAGAGYVLRDLDEVAVAMAVAPAQLQFDVVTGGRLG